MKYKALKPCRFDRFYSIGETIPADAVAYNMASKLIAIGLITPLPDEYAGNSDTEDEQAEESSGAEGEQEPQKDGNEFEGVNDQAEENSGTEGEQVPQEGDDKPERKRSRKPKNQAAGE